MHTSHYQRVIVFANYFGLYRKLYIQSVVCVGVLWLRRSVHKVFGTWYTDENVKVRGQTKNGFLSYIHCMV